MVEARNGSQRPAAGLVVRSFHSSTRAPGFGQMGSRVSKLADEARTGRLVNAYDPQKAYVLSVVSGWAYSDGQTLADKVQYYGFEDGAHVQQLSVVNEAMLVVACAYLIRSQDGRAGILVFRGTEPDNAMNWLGNADTEAVDFYGRGLVYQGFYSNVEALWSYVEAALRQAAEGRAPSDDGASEGGPQLAPLEHLYITGHSLGGAMAVLAAAKIFFDDAYAAWRPLIRGVYTFGQPLVGDTRFARSCADLEPLVYRHEYRHDVIPVLPPSSVAHAFAHIGQKRLTSSPEQPWQISDQPTRPLWFLVEALASVSAAFFTRRLLLLRRLDGLLYSLDDHSPQRYINTCKRSLFVLEGATAASAGPMERVKTIAHVAAEAGKHVLMRTRTAPPARPPAPM